MSLFGGAQKVSYLGVDIGTAGVKLVELVSERGRARLLTYGWSEREPEAAGSSPMDSPEETIALLKKVWTKAGCVSRKAISGIPISQVFSSIISVNIPAAKKKELDAAIKLQAQKITPRPLEEMVLDYKIVEEGPKQTKVLITAAEASLVRKYIEIFKKSGLELVSLETEALALIRSLVGRDLSTIIIVDIGALRTNISIVEKGIPVVSRSIDIGGLSFTRVLSDQLKMRLAAAEQMKLDLGALKAMLPAAGLPPMLQSLAETILNELRYVVNIYLSQQGVAGGVEKIQLTGGASLFPRLPEVINNALGIKTFLGDPWARVVYPEDLRPVLDQIGPRFAVAVGLAMRDIE
ncbi:type IV pilus assembly protein PilM [Patescibacteria group bacterium]|nr:MAG: type IV pilus assembly protein PilM [Patescibacteria group bacterium]